MLVLEGRWESGLGWVGGLCLRMGVGRVVRYHAEGILMGDEVSALVLEEAENLVVVGELLREVPVGVGVVLLEAS